MTELIDLGAGDSWTFRLKGHSHDGVGKESEAVIDYRTALSLDSNDAKANNALASIYATSKNGDLRNWKSAVTLATRACQATEFKKAYIFDTLAAAYAESGDFRNAVRWQEKALELAPAESKEDYRSRLELCKVRKPCRE